MYLRTHQYVKARRKAGGANGAILGPEMTNLEDENPAGKPSTATHTNRLINEKSPYLLQHARNPVDWYPWGEEAFEKARHEHKPIFLSVGYYTCHWCHVMERESFEDAGVAEILNRSFVPIKVDREERPDIDRVYMSFVQATTGSGGWPMSVFLTPELKPFFGGTYFPPEDHYGRAGFRSLLRRLEQVWHENRERAVSSADQVTAALQQYAGASKRSDTLPGALVLERLYEQLRSGYDAVYGGFGGAPKFPRPVVLNFLLRYWKRTGEQHALEMTLNTVRAMAAGGMYDQIGGGFHRYSVDFRWHVPHFEKMLYDQAQLASSYTEAFQITHEAAHAAVVGDVLDYVLREMRAPEGGFYSAQDADSAVAAWSDQHAEGAFYVWTAEEVNSSLGPEVAPIFAYCYGVEPRGNVPAEVDAHGELTGKNVLYQQYSLCETAEHFGASLEKITSVLTSARQRLFELRAGRPHPPTDDKVITAWNGLMISAFAHAAQALDEPRYVTAAIEAARFIESALYLPAEQRLYRRWREGNVAIEAFVDDYTFLIQGLLDLYQATFDTHWLLWAMELQAKQDELFWDRNSGGYFATTGADQSVLLRMREDYDGAEPSPNSIAALNLLRLSRFTGRAEWRERGEQTLRAFGTRLQTLAEAMPQMAVALDYALSKPMEIVVAGEPGAEDTEALLRVVRQRFLPHAVVLEADGGPHQQQLAKWLPFLSSIGRQNGRATAYVCENYACNLPVTSPEELAKLLQ
jgi:uncharacterized protein YyaL (SSP411 family)